MKKKRTPMRVTYHYIKPKNEEEAKEQQRSVEKAFDIVFEEMLKKKQRELENG